jgi:hypothetical protein
MRGPADACLFFCQVHDPLRYQCGVTDEFVQMHVDPLYQSSSGTNFSAMAATGVHKRFLPGCPTTRKVVYMVRPT